MDSLANDRYSASYSAIALAWMLECTLWSNLSVFILVFVKELEGCSHLVKSSDSWETLQCHWYVGVHRTSRCKGRKCEYLISRLACLQGGKAKITSHLLPLLAQFQTMTTNQFLFSLSCMSGNLPWVYMITLTNGFKSFDIPRRSEIILTHEDEHCHQSCSQG